MLDLHLFFGYVFRENTFIKSCLDALVKYKVISFFLIHDGVLEYVFSDGILENLHPEHHFYKIDIVIASKFSTRDAYIIYSVLRCYEGVLYSIVFTETSLRRYLKTSLYFNYKKGRERLFRKFKRAVCEINQKTTYNLGVEKGKKEQEKHLKIFLILKKSQEKIKPIVIQEVARL